MSDPYSGPPGYPPPGYPPPGYPTAYPPHLPPPRRTNGLAIASLVVSCVSVMLCPLLGCIGAILGHSARGQIRQTGEDGDGLALAGIIVGWILFGATMLLIAGWVLLVALAAAGDGA